MHYPVMAGLVAAISLREAKCFPKRDARVKITAGPAEGRTRLPAHDK